MGNVRLEDCCTRSSACMRANKWRRSWACREEQGKGAKKRGRTRAIVISLAETAFDDASLLVLEPLGAAHAP